MTSCECPSDEHDEYEGCQRLAPLDEDGSEALCDECAMGNHGDG